MSRLNSLIVSLAVLALLSACQSLNPGGKASLSTPDPATAQTAQATQSQPQQSEPQVLIFLAQAQAADHLQKVQLSDTESIYVLPQPILTRRDLNKMQILDNKNQQKSILLFALHPDGAKKLADVSSQHVGKYLALVVDGSLLALPRIAAPLTKGVLDIPFQDHQRAQAAAAAIVGQPAR